MQFVGARFLNFFERRRSVWGSSLRCRFKNADLLTVNNTPYKESLYLKPRKAVDFSFSSKLRCHELMALKFTLSFTRYLALHSRELLLSDFHESI